MEKFTFKKFKQLYPNDDACLDALFKQRFKAFTHCPKCKAAFSYKRVKSVSVTHRETRKCYQCDTCSHQLYPMVGTIYEKTRTPLTYWFYAIFLFTTTRNGVAAKELQRQLGVTYKTAFRLGHRVRQLMNNTHETYLDGIIQIDETFVGGKVKNMHSLQASSLGV